MQRIRLGRWGILLPFLREPMAFHMNPPHVLGIGAATWDHFVMVPEFPQDEGITQALATAEQGGGPVATAMCVLAHLGTPAVLLDAQGDDPTGRLIIRDLQRHAVFTDHIRIESGASSAVAHILVRQRDGARHIFFRPATVSAIRAEDVDPSLVKDASLLHLNGRHEKAARHAATLAKEVGILVSFDGGAGRYRESIRDLVLASDLRILAKEFALKYAGASTLEGAAAELLRDNPSLLVITDGVAGSHIWSRGEEPFHQPATHVDEVVDTTGCGDVFHGAFLHGWHQRWPIKKTAQFAADLAAKTARGLGGRWALPTPPSPAA